MQNQILGFFIITTIAFAGLSAVQWKRAAQYRDQVEAVRREAFEEAHRAGMQEAEVRSLERRIQQRDEDTAALTEMVQELMASTNQLTLALAGAQAQVRDLNAAAGSGSAAGEGEGAQGPNSHPMGVIGQMLKDPSMQEMVRAQQKMILDTMYGSLFQDLNLTDDQTKAFKELLLDAQMANMRMGADAMSGDETQRREAVETLTREKEGIEAEIKAFLGEEGFAVYQDYQKTMGERVMLNQFKSQLDTSRNPLQDDQFARLVQAAVEEKQNAPAPFTDPANDPRQAMEMMKSAEMQEAHLAQQESVNQRVLRRAQNFLAPDQIASLQEFMDNQMKMMRLGLEMSRRMTAETGGETVTVPAPTVAVPGP